MTDSGEVLDSFSGCKNIQTEASNEQQDQPPASPGWTRGILWFWAQREKEENHISHRAVAWLDPTRKALRKGPVTPPWAHHSGHCSFWIQNRNIREFLNLYPKENWTYKLRYPRVKEQQKRSWGHSTSSGNLLSVCTRAGTYWEQSPPNTRGKGSFGRKPEVKYSINKDLVLWKFL